MAASDDSSVGGFEFILLVFVFIAFMGAFIYFTTYIKAKAVDQVVHEHHENKMKEQS
jgi:hypothetical protein